MKKSGFFIIGSKRGGTTLLRLMLNKHTQLIIPPESHFILPLVKTFPYLDRSLSFSQLEEIKSIIINHPRFDTWKMDAEEVDSVINSLDEPRILAAVIEGLFLRKIRDSGKTTWGEKTPEYIDIIPQLNSLFPESKFIALVRDGRDVAISLKDRGWEGWSIYQRAIYWKRCIRNIEFLNKLGNRTLMVKYERLVTNVEEVLSEITEFLDVVFEDKMLQFNQDYAKNITETEIKSGVHKKLNRMPDPKADIGRWALQMSNSEVWRFESICHKELRLMDYDVAYYNQNNFLHRLGSFLYRIIGKIIVLLHVIYHFLFSRNVKQKLRKNRQYNKLRSLIVKS